MLDARVVGVEDRVCEHGDGHRVRSGASHVVTPESGERGSGREADYLVIENQRPAVKRRRTTLLPFRLPPAFALRPAGRG